MYYKINTTALRRDIERERCEIATVGLNGLSRRFTLKSQFYGEAFIQKLKFKRSRNESISPQSRAL